MLTKAKLKELKKAWNSNMADAEVGPLLEHIAEQSARIAALESSLAEREKECERLREAREDERELADGLCVRVTAAESSLAERERECEMLRAETRWHDRVSDEMLVRTSEEAVKLIRAAESRAEAAESALAAAREENERLRDRIERAQERLDRDPAGNPNYLALSADLRGEIGRVGGVPQYDSAALRRADDAALQGVGARDDGRVERVAKWMRLEEFGEGWEELDDGEREAWRRKASSVLAAADGEPRGVR